MITGELHDLACSRDPCTCDEVVVMRLPAFDAPKPSKVLREPKTLRQKLHPLRKKGKATE